MSITGVFSTPEDCIIGIRTLYGISSEQITVDYVLNFFCRLTGEQLSSSPTRYTDPIPSPLLFNTLSHIRGLYDDILHNETTTQEMRDNASNQIDLFNEACDEWHYFDELHDGNHLPIHIHSNENNDIDDTNDTDNNYDTYYNRYRVIRHLQSH